jgi:hypothetical protein
MWELSHREIEIGVSAIHWLVNGPPFSNPEAQTKGLNHDRTNMDTSTGSFANHQELPDISLYGSL